MFPAGSLSPNPHLNSLVIEGPTNVQIENLFRSYLEDGYGLPKDLVRFMLFESSRTEAVLLSLLERKLKGMPYAHPLLSKFRKSGNGRYRKMSEQKRKTFKMDL